MGIREGEEWEKGTKGLFEITMTENVSKINDPQTHRSRKLREFQKW